MDTQSVHPLVSIVVLNWNGEDIIAECLDSLLLLEYQPVEIIVVDNASTDGSVAILQKYENIQLICCEKNLGYARGNNYGVEHARGKYVATLNNDMTVHAKWLNDPVKYLEQVPDIGSICCRQMLYRQRDIVDSLFEFPERHLLLGRMGHNKNIREFSAWLTPGYVIGPNGGSAIYRKKMFDDLGGFDDDFFAYHEECDLAMRAFFTGWRCLYVPSAEVFHKGSVSFNKRKRTFYYFHERNRIWFIYKNFPMSIILANLGTILFRELRTIIGIAMLRPYLMTYAKARIDGFSGIGRYGRIRNENVNLFKKRRKAFELFLKERMLPLEADIPAPQK